MLTKLNYFLQPQNKILKNKYVYIYMYIIKLRPLNIIYISPKIMSYGLSFLKLLLLLLYI